MLLEPNDVELPVVSCRPGWLCVVLCCLAGCAPAEVETTYGKRRGSNGGASVNGTAVLAGIFEQSGWRVRTWRRLSPKLDRADVIVWIPDDFGLPTPQQRQFLEQWLDDRAERTLVYVGRSYDAAIAYWKFSRHNAPAPQAMEAARRLATVRSEFDAARAGLPPSEDGGWFTVHHEAVLRPVRELGGPWSAGIDASRTEITTAGGLEAGSDSEARTLLAAADKALVIERTVGDGKLVSVVNGSFLLNLPLVNHEHRKLAGRLVAACGPPGTVIFLESQAGGPPIAARDPAASGTTGLEMFTVPPLGTILLHFAIAGITLCIACFPIFGRPRELPVASTSDFGKHVSALGELLSRTRDRQYAISRLKYYNENVRRDPG